MRRELICAGVCRPTDWLTDGLTGFVLTGNVRCDRVCLSLWLTQSVHIHSLSSAGVWYGYDFSLKLTWFNVQLQVSSLAVGLWTRLRLSVLMTAPTTVMFYSATETCLSSDLRNSYRTVSWLSCVFSAKRSLYSIVWTQFRHITHAISLNASFTRREITFHNLRWHRRQHCLAACTTFVLRSSFWLWLTAWINFDGGYIRTRNSLRFLFAALTSCAALVNNAEQTERNVEEWDCWGCR